MTSRGSLALPLLSLWSGLGFFSGKVTSPPSSSPLPSSNSRLSCSVGALVARHYSILFRSDQFPTQLLEPLRITPCSQSKMALRCPLMAFPGFFLRPLLKDFVWTAVFGARLNGFRLFAAIKELRTWFIHFSLSFSSRFLARWSAWPTPVSLFCFLCVVLPSNFRSVFLLELFLRTTPGTVPILFLTSFRVR